MAGGKEVERTFFGRLVSMACSVRTQKKKKQTQEGAKDYSVRRHGKAARNRGAKGYCRRI